MGGNRIAVEGEHIEVEKEHIQAADVGEHTEVEGEQIQAGGAAEHIAVRWGLIAHAAGSQGKAVDVREWGKLASWTPDPSGKFIFGD